VDTDAIALKVKQEFAAKDKLKKTPKAVSKAKKALECGSRERELPTGSPLVAPLERLRGLSPTSMVPDASGAFAGASGAGPGLPTRPASVCAIRKVRDDAAAAVS